jgi:hypothetical protein
VVAPPAGRWRRNRQSLRRRKSDDAIGLLERRSERLLAQEVDAGAEQPFGDLRMRLRGHRDGGEVDLAEHVAELGGRPRADLRRNLFGPPAVGVDDVLELYARQPGELVDVPAAEVAGADHCGVSCSTGITLSDFLR